MARTRRRSETFELYSKAGSIVRELNRERRHDDEKKQPKDDQSQFPYWIFQGKNKEPHRNSTRFEQNGRVPRQSEEEYQG